MCCYHCLSAPTVKALLNDIVIDYNAYIIKIHKRPLPVRLRADYLPPAEPAFKVPQVHSEKFYG